MINSNSLGCRIQDLGTRGKHQTKKKLSWCTSRGCRVQNSGPWVPWLLVVEKRRLFAQRAHSTGTAHSAPPSVRLRHIVGRACISSDSYICPDKTSPVIAKPKPRLPCNEIVRIL